jgi:hypothetical protein
MNEPLAPEHWLSKADLVDLLSLYFYEYAWKGNIDIIPEWWPNYPPENYRPIVAVGIKRKYLRTDDPEPESYSYLRHSRGPHQCFFWGVYPDDMQSVGIAILAIQQASLPVWAHQIFHDRKK